MENIQTTVTDIQSQLKVIVAQLNAQNVQLEELKNSMTSKDLKLEELTKLNREMLVKQDLVCSDTMTIQKGSISSTSGGASKAKAKTKSTVAKSDDGEFSHIKLTNIREFFKSLFVSNRDVFKVRDEDDEFKESHGITQNGFLTDEIINAKYEEEKEGIDKKKKQEEKDKTLANKLYGDLSKDDKNTIECMKGEFFAFKEKRKIINLQVDNEEPDDEAVSPGDDDVEE